MYGDINGRSGRRAVGTADLYRRVPKDMTDATKVGVVMTLLSVATMFVLFFCETQAFFLQTRVTNSLKIDTNVEQNVRLNFNVTLDDLHCDYVYIDVWDTLGTNMQNVTKDVIKWSLEQGGKKKIFHGRNREELELVHEEHDETLGELHETGGVYAVDLNPDSFQRFIEGHDDAFVDLFAPWCIWCQRLAPTWEKFAREVHDRKLSLGVGLLDCVAHAQLCKDQKVMAFPTLRWYENGLTKTNYGGDRTVNALIDYATAHVKDTNNVKDTNPKGRRANVTPELKHSGCMVTGHLMVNRVPGKIHISARSANHELDPAMTNLTHRVNRFTFGSTERSAAPLAHLLHLKHLDPLQGKHYPTDKYHQAFHHELKVVSTHVDYLFPKSATLYQILEQSQLVYYNEIEVPEIKFSYDLSPISVSISRKGRKWYEYVTSICAIIGGTYTSLGLINRTLLQLFKPKAL